MPDEDAPSEMSNAGERGAASAKGARGPASYEVMLAWSLSLDADARTRALTGPSFVGFVSDADDDASVRQHAFSPADLLARTTGDGAFGCDAHQDGVWTFSCQLHEDDWANGDAEGLVRTLARRAKEASGVVLAAQMEEICDAWIVARGKVRKIDPLPEVAFAPAMTAEGVASALAVARDACAAVKPARLPDFVREIPPLVRRHLCAFDLQATEDPLRYRFAGHPGFELRFELRKRSCTPTLYRAGTDRRDGHTFSPLDPANLDESVADLASDRYDALAVELPFFLLEHGASVSTEAILAIVAKDQRWMIKRVPEASSAGAELLARCADHLLAGVWDDLARETLIAIVQHPNSPIALARRLATHTSRSLQQAAAARLQRS